MSDQPIVGTLDERFVTGEQPHRRRRRRSIKDPELRALRAFADALNLMPRQAQKAAIAWLASKYLGIRIG
jgi:hypothetical protein